MTMGRTTTHRLAALTAVLGLAVALTACTPPPTPGDVVLTPGENQLAVAFQPGVALLPDAQAAIYYYVTAWDGDRPVNTVVTFSHAATVGGLENGHTYAVTVTARGEDLDSVSSVPVYGTPRTVPGAPTSVSAQAGAGSAEVTFAAPTSNGGAAITSYTVTASDGVHPPVTVAGTSSPITVTGLLGRTTYSVTVTATNEAGAGAASAPSAVTTPGAPDAPVDVVATPISGGVEVSFDPPAWDGDATIVGYTVVYGDGDDSHVFLPVTGATSPIVVTGLSDSIQYSFTVFAQNAIGTSLASATVTATPLA